MVQKPTFTPKGRLKIVSMLFLWGKEWGAINSIKQSLDGINNSLKDLVEMQREKLELSNTIQVS